MINFYQFKKEFVLLIEKLSSKPKIGGLQISNAAFQFVLIDKGKPITVALRLPPDILKNGRIADRAKFSELLHQLHQMILPGRKRERIKVIVSLPSELIFSQNFSVPNVGIKNLKETAKLNLQIISPLPIEKACVDWQIINELPERYELLGVLADKEKVDEFSNLLVEAGFLPAATEFPALAVARLLNQEMNLNAKTMLVIMISSDGLDLFFLKNGQLYFEHFLSWHSIQGERRQITKSDFEKTIVEEVQRVVNFALSRFREKIDKAVLIAAGLEQEITAILTNHFSFTILPFQMKRFPELGASWFPALGSALRGEKERSADFEISLSSMATIKEFYHEQILNFISLWRRIGLTVFGFFLILFISISIFLVNIFRHQENQLRSFNTQPVVEELHFLEEKVKEFNRLVTLIVQAKNTDLPLKEILGELKSTADKNQIKLESISIVSLKEPIKISARAPNNAAAIQFKNDLAAKPQFQNIEMPLATISYLEDNTVSFLISFNFQQ